MKTRALLVALLAVACDRTTSTKPSPIASSHPTATALEHPEAAASGASQPRPPSHAAFLSFEGSVGKGQPVRIALERVGERLEGLVRIGGEPVSVRGEIKDARQVTFTEVKAAVTKATMFEGTLEGSKLQGTWNEPTAKQARSLTAGPSNPFPTKADEAFEQSFAGLLGAKTRIVAKFKKASDGTLSGRYRYPRSQEDLRLSGRLNPADGSFDLTETNEKDERTGTMTGVFLDRRTIFGRWASPDGQKTFRVVLHGAESYPELVSLRGGGKLIPVEDTVEPNQFCSLRVAFPELSGSRAKEKEKSLNTELRKAAGTVSKRDCEGASEATQYEVDTTYVVSAQRRDYVAFQFEHYEYTGGAHGNHAYSCPVADFRAGKLTRITANMLFPEGRKQLNRYVNEELRKTEYAEYLSEEVAIGDETTLCVSGTDLVVQFQQSEIGPYAMGAPRVTMRASAAYPLFEKSPLIDALLRDEK